MRKAFNSRLSIVMILAVALIMVMSAGNPVSAASKNKAPARVTKVKAETTGEQTVVLTWKKLGKRVSGYEIYRDGKRIARVKKSKHKYTDNGLKAGTKYKYKVRAYRNIRKKNHKKIRKYGKYSSVAKVQTKAKEKKTIGATNAKDLSDAQIQQTMLSKINKFRSENGVGPLKLQPEICDLAICRAEFIDLFGVVTHNIPFIGTAGDTLTGSDITYSYIGENIAGGQKTINKVLKAWKASEGHRANLLNANYTHLGVGHYNHKWVLIFVTGAEHRCDICGEDLLGEGYILDNLEEKTDYTAHFSYDGFEDSKKIKVYVCKHCGAIDNLYLESLDLFDWDEMLSDGESLRDYVTWTDASGNPGAWG